MARTRKWEIDGQLVTEADVRRWVKVFAPHVDKDWQEYARMWSVHRKVAACKARGTFDELIAREAARRGLTLRKARSPNRLYRFRQDWPDAANDAQMVPLVERLDGYKAEAQIKQQEAR